MKLTDAEYAEFEHLLIERWFPSLHSSICVDDPAATAREIVRRYRSSALQDAVTTVVRTTVADLRRMVPR